MYVYVVLLDTQIKIFDNKILVLAQAIENCNCIKCDESCFNNSGENSYCTVKKKIYK